MTMHRVLIFTFISFMSAHAHAVVSPYVVVTSASEKQTVLTDRDELRAIFLGEQLFWEDDERVFAVISKLSSTETSRFFTEVLDLERDEYTSYWRRKLFAGKGHPPREFDTDASALDYIRGNAGSIGVLSKKPAGAELKGLRVFRVDPVVEQLIQGGK